jgi:Family of unknown function (DUF6152)
MSKKFARVSTTTCFIAAISFSLFAHHGTGGTYDMERPITLTGTVTEFRFVNPHVLIFFDVPDKNGKNGVTNWLAEGPSVINWTRTGWNRNSIKAKDRIVVTLFPARSGKPDGVVRKIVTANGKEWCCESK